MAAKRRKPVPRYRPHSFRSGAQSAADHRRQAKYEIKIARGYEKAAKKRRSTHGPNKLSNDWMREARAHRKRAKTHLEHAKRYSGVYSRDVKKPKKRLAKSFSYENAAGGIHSPSNKKRFGTFYVTYHSAWLQGNTVVAVNFKTRAAAQRWISGRTRGNVKAHQAHKIWREERML